ncbi:putative Histidinol-phosphate aminotransferase [Streptomyces aurantiacus JA 4570]|uniref:Aminotransferase n=1 Tax=Streptomyces aurantiacus JA 4570 TaxID=1286094 RepID=S4A7E2_9ACTN|nr:putative Histidinol-phosphate aminotransferase [Streptomyces aurantiacus JA 4570]
MPAADAPEWIRDLFLTQAGEVQPYWRSRVGGAVNLANNEMRHPRVEELIRAAAARLLPEDWTSYPDYVRARAQFAELLGVPADRLLFTAGSDQTYRAVFQALTAPGTQVITQVPNYEQIFPYAALGGLSVHGVAHRPGTGFPLPAFLDAVSRAAPGSLVTVSNPNGPTGAWWPPHDLEALVDACAARRCLLLIDEAYGAFAPATVLNLAPRRPHVVVVQSFSKAFGLAGARLAVCVCGSPEVADHIQRWNVTNPVSGPALAVAADLAGRVTEMADVYAELAASRARLRELVPELVGGRAEESFGNFQPVRCPDADTAARCVAGLAKRGFAIRHLVRFGLPEYIRISTADLQTTDRLITALEQTVRDTPRRSTRC